jgi:uncharacterized protein YndB with AHSA1/START domain
MSTTDTVKVYELEIKASPEKIWEAITTPEWTAKYGYGTRAEYDLRPGGRYQGLGVAGEGDFLTVEGEVLEVDAPRKLVQTYRLMFDAEFAAEPLTRVTWELEDKGDGVTLLRVTHDLAGAPKTAIGVTGEHPEYGGGWPMILESLKALLEG